MSGHPGRKRPPSANGTLEQGTADRGRLDHGTLDRGRDRHLLVVLLLALALVPLLARDPFFLGLIASGFAIAIAVYGLDFLLGRGGQLSLAHAGFFGIGGYAQGVLTTSGGLPFWGALPLAIAFAMLLGYIVGAAAFRTRADSFAIFTLAVGVMIRIVIERWESVTGGTDGLVGIPAPPALGGVDFRDPAAQYYLALAFLTAAILAARAFGASPFGRRLDAIHHGEETAQALGIDPGETQRAAFVVSVTLAALGGALYASLLGFIGPAMASVTITFLMLVYLMVGGVGSAAGPLLGTLVITLLIQGLQVFEGRQMMVLGGGLVILMIVLPGGLAGLVGLVGRRLARGAG